MVRLKAFIKYIRHLWEGKDGYPSIRTILAIWLTFNLTKNIDYAIRHCLDRIAEVTMLLGLEVSLIVALLSLKLYENLRTKNNPLDTNVS